MSSPRRAVKNAAAKGGARPGRAVKRVATTRVKKARRTPPLRVAEPILAEAEGVATAVRQAAAALERSIIDGKLDMLPADALQALVAAACRLYAARREAGERIMPVARHSITATDVMVTASGLLQAADLAVFELGMWQSWTGR